MAARGSSTPITTSIRPTTPRRRSAASSATRRRCRRSAYTGWTPHFALDQMEKAGIATAIVLDHQPRHLVRRRRRRGARAGARLQRVRRRDGARLSRPLRHVRGDPAARHRRQPRRDRLCVRRAEARRHRPDDELRGQAPRRSRLRAGLRRVQPPQGQGLRPSDHVLRPAFSRHRLADDRVPDRYRAHDRQPHLLRHGRALRRHHLHLLAWRRHAAHGGAALRPHGRRTRARGARAQAAQGARSRTASGNITISPASAPRRSGWRRC